MTRLDEIANVRALLCSPSHRGAKVEEEQTLEQPVEQTTADDQFEWVDEEILVHEWRAEQLQRLGLSRLLAEGFAGRVDWHDFAGLVADGCSPELALDILY
jgi:hypothetical protein